MCHNLIKLITTLAPPELRLHVTYNFFYDLMLPVILEMICELFFLCVLALNTTITKLLCRRFFCTVHYNKCYFHTEVKPGRGLVGGNWKVVCLRSRQSNTTWTLSDECDNTYFYMNYCDAAPQIKSD